MNTYVSNVTVTIILCLANIITNNSINDDNCYLYKKNYEKLNTKVNFGTQKINL